MPRTRTLLEWTDADGVTGAIEIDATKTRGFELVAEVTEFPVETGTDVTDNVRPQNGVISIEGVISNTPMVVPSTQMQGVTLGPGAVTLADGQTRATLVRFSGPFDRVHVCDGLFQQLHATSTPVKITTSLRTVADLAIARYKVDQNADTGQSLGFILELRKLRIVSTQRVRVPAVRRLQITSNRAVQPTDNRSVLARSLDGGAPASSARQRAQAALAARGGGVGL